MRRIFINSTKDIKRKNNTVQSIFPRKLQKNSEINPNSQIMLCQPGIFEIQDFFFEKVTFQVTFFTSKRCNHISTDEFKPQNARFSRRAFFIFTKGYIFEKLMSQFQIRQPKNNDLFFNNNRNIL